MPAVMKTSASLSRLLVLFLLVACLSVVCSSAYQTPIPPTATATQTVTPLPTFTRAPSQTPETVPDTGWNMLQSGLERRTIDIYDDENHQVEWLYMLRLDPGLFRLDVGYRETPQNLEDWQKETKALIVLNGGYFRIENERYLPNGLIIVNGQALGETYDAFAGMLAISDYDVELRWLAEKPFDPYEPLRAALQSFPVLVKPGGELGFPAQQEDNVQARRTVIGQDREGRILFIVAPRGHFTLHQLSVFLTGSDLHLDIAVNLDGGPSTGIFLAEPREIIPAQTLSPIVILAYPQ